MIVRAYQTLSDDSERAVYDESLIKPGDYYTVRLGPLRISLKLLFLTSLGCLGLAFLSKPEVVETDEECPSEHKVRRLGMAQQIDTQEKTEDPEVRWARIAKKSQPTSMRAPLKSKGIFAKKSEAKTLDIRPIKVVLPSQRSTSAKLSEVASNSRS